MKLVRALVIALVLTLGWQAQAQAPDEQYVGIFHTIQEADAALASGQAQVAVARYLEAQAALRKLQSVYPDWNASIVKFRLEYVAGKVATAANLPAKPVLETPATKPEPPAKSAEPNPELVNELKALREQVGHLQADKNLLEAKLKEALAAQPAAVDPRELARTEERVRTLEKEADLLKVTLEQERGKKPAATNAPAPDRLRKELAEANRQAAELGDQVKSLAREKAQIQRQLDDLKATKGVSNTELVQTRQALAEASRRIEEQSAANQSLVQEKEALQARIKSLGTDADTLAALRAENELLKKQAAEAKAASGKSPAEQELQQARTRIAALQSDLALLRTEKAALENHAKTPPATSAPAVAVTPSPTDAERLAQLIQERDELQVKLDKALRDLVRGKTEAKAQAQETANQLAALRARIEVLEARPIPYSAEELAMMKAPAPRLAVPPAQAKATSQSAPPAATSVTLIAEAQRQFAARQFDKAEENYLQALRQDDRSVVTLANLAVTEMQLGKLDDAEARARQAVTVAPDDAFSHMVLGQVKMRQEEYDAAVDALSRAAQLNPQSAEVQNYLGIALSHKGLRIPAETALRKAVTLEPGYGSAHNNLAVIYLNQNPPMVALARWHYQKALAAGAPKNPELEKALEEQGESTAKP